MDAYETLRFALSDKWGVLFKYFHHRTTHPNLWTFQTEDFKNGRSAVELHHASLHFATFLDALTSDDERCFYFFQSLTAMAMVDAAVIGSNDEDTLVIDAGIKFGEEFRGEKVPTLEEFLELMATRPDIKLLLELKDYPEELGDFAYRTADKIVAAVEEGRGIYANIKKVVGFLLGTNIGEVITVFVAMLLWHKSPLLSMQLLWINLVTDSLPAIALGMEAVETDIMDREPKPRGEGLFAHGFGVRTVLQGVMFGALSLIAFRLGEAGTGQEAGGQTVAFLVLALSQVVQAYNMRSEHSLFKIGVFTNHKLNWAALTSVLLVALVLFTPLAGPFGLMRLPASLYLEGLGLIFVPFVVMEFSKAFGLIKHQH